MRFIIILLLALITGHNSFSQDIAAYGYDRQNQITFFEAGSEFQLRWKNDSPIEEGGACVAYTDMGGVHRVFYKGKSTSLKVTEVTNSWNTDNWYVYQVGLTLKVFDHGAIYRAHSWAENPVIGDSVMAFTNANTGQFLAFYNDEVITLEEPSSKSVRSVQAVENVVSYVDAVDNFKVFWRGDVYELTMQNKPLSQFTGRNTVAYFDQIENVFRVFYKGEEFDLENLNPEKIAVGDDLVAYTTRLGNFNVFDRGELVQVLPSIPKKFKVVDELMAYVFNNEFHVFYKGEDYLIDSGYEPENWQMDNDKLVYEDRYKNIVLFDKGKTRVISRLAGTAYSLNRDVITLNSGNGFVNFWWKGKLHDTYGKY